MVVKWNFLDPAGSDSYTFEVNPLSGADPQYDKSITYQSTTAPGGKTLIMEGQDKPLEISWSGTIISESQYDAYVTWFQKRRQIQLTDDLGRVFWIYISSFESQRVRSSNFHKRTYNVKATVLDWS